MKKILLILSIIAISVTVGCQKDDEGDGINSFTVRFVNNSSNPYYLKIDGSFKDEISGNTYQDFAIDKGSHDWEVTQVSGYALYPTTKDGSFYADQDLTITFP